MSGLQVWRIALILAATTAMSTVRADESCFTVYCDEGSEDFIKNGELKISPADSMTLTICPRSGVWYSWREDRSELKSVVAVSTQAYVLEKEDIGKGYGNKTALDRMTGELSSLTWTPYWRSSLKHPCKKVALKPIPKDAGKPKF
jgi:hypothetical protein